ncbi:desulfoferrodoxin family protein [Thermodesulfatator atlanticus]
MERRDFLKKVLGGAAAFSVLSAVNIARASEDEYHEYKSEYYEHKKEKYLRLKNPANPSMLEKKHVPAIVAPKKVKAGEWFEVEVKVGYKVTHPSTPKHWISDIYLLCDGKKIAEVEYPVGGVASSSAKFSIRLNKSATLEAVEHCNLHGTWISKPFKIEVY